MPKAIDLTGTLLDCVPGRADQPGIGEKIAMLTVEHKGEIEAPMMLSLPDMKKLAVALLGVVFHHTGQSVGEIVNEFLDESDELAQPMQIDWERHARNIDPHDVAAVMHGRSPQSEYDPHANIVPLSAIADWLLGSACPLCREPFAVDDVQFEEWCILGRKWASRWKVACPRCRTSHRLTVSCMPRRMRL